MKFEYENYTVIVTGGTRGIGRGISEAFLRAGAKVIATYSGNDAAAEEFRKSAGELSLEIARFDVSNYAEVEKFFDEFDSRYDSLEVLVNNAGIRKDCIAGMMSPEEWQRVIDVNLTGTFYMSKLAITKMMPGRFGRIINISSPSGRDGFAGQANYSASKAGQVGFTKSLAKETARKKITVNCVSPGFIETDLISDLSPELLEKYKSLVPAGRFGKPGEVADAVLFLASREASYINGAVVDVNGGI